MSRGGRSTKIHAVVDALGNPIHVQLSAGNVHDVRAAQEMLEAVKLRPGVTVIADKAYGKRELRKPLPDKIIQNAIESCRLS